MWVLFKLTNGGGLVLVHEHDIAEIWAKPDAGHFEVKRREGEQLRADSFEPFYTMLEAGLKMVSDTTALDAQPQG